MYSSTVRQEDSNACFDTFSLNHVHTSTYVDCLLYFSLNYGLFFLIVIRVKDKFPNTIMGNPMRIKCMVCGVFVNLNRIFYDFQKRKLV